MQAKAVPKYRRLFPVETSRKNNFPLFYVSFQYIMLCTQCMRISRTYLETYEKMRLSVSTLKVANCKLQLAILLVVTHLITIIIAYGKLFPFPPIILIYGKSTFRKIKK